MTQFAKNYAQYYNLFNSDKPYQKEIEFVYEWAEKPKSIFDIGSGTGSYWKFYPKETQLMGVEKSQSMIPKTQQIICADIMTYKHKGAFDCATALFDVINYIPRHDWWKNIPSDTFIFDMWDKKKVLKDGFKETTKKIGGVTRNIVPLHWDKKRVYLRIQVYEEATERFFEEEHVMHLHSHEDIERFCGKQFKIVDVVPTRRWMTWYKLKRK